MSYVLQQALRQTQSRLRPSFEELNQAEQQMMELDSARDDLEEIREAVASSEPGIVDEGRALYADWLAENNRDPKMVEVLTNDQVVDSVDRILDNIEAVSMEAGVMQTVTEGLTRWREQLRISTANLQKLGNLLREKQDWFESHQVLLTEAKPYVFLHRGGQQVTKLGGLFDPDTAFFKKAEAHVQRLLEEAAEVGREFHQIKENSSVGSIDDLTNRLAQQASNPNQFKDLDRTDLLGNYQVTVTTKGDLEYKRLPYKKLQLEKGDTARAIRDGIVAGAAVALVVGSGGFMVGVVAAGAANVQTSVSMLRRAAVKSNTQWTVKDLEALVTKALEMERLIGSFKSLRGDVKDRIKAADEALDDMFRKAVDEAGKKDREKVTAIKRLRKVLRNTLYSDLYHAGQLNRIMLMHHTLLVEGTEALCRASLRYALKNE